MTQAINTNGQAQVIPLRDPVKHEQTKANRDRSADDVGAAEIQSSSVSSVDNSESSKDPLERAAEIIQEVLPEDGLQNTRLRINKDDNTGNFVYQTLDNETGEVIKQFPPETIMEMLSKMREVEGLTLDSLA